MESRLLEELRYYLTPEGEKAYEDYDVPFAERLIMDYLYHSPSTLKGIRREVPVCVRKWLPGLVQRELVDFEVVD